MSTHKVVSGDTLYSLAKKYRTTVNELKSLNGLKSDLIKIGQTLKLPIAKNTQSALNFPFVIAKSKNTLSGLDSKHSKGKKLPEKFYTGGGKIYSLSKQQLLERLIDLMEIGSMGKNELFARDMATRFSQNRSYDLNNAYTHPELVNMVRQSEKFKTYVAIVTNDIKQALADKKSIIENGKLIVSKELPRFHFKEENRNYYETGLIITIDQVSYVEIELNDVIYQNGKPAKLKTTFIVHDTYGLDDEDLNKYGLLSETSLEGWDTFVKRDWKQKGLSTAFGFLFNCWWVLQYYHDCVPLLVKLRVENVEITL